ncbi:FUN14 family-domain-containing protein [Dichotomocladium elegans]|nr:FUN14 family-domain-containing protein [Dichotomocladium elegans]
MLFPNIIMNKTTKGVSTDDYKTKTRKNYSPIWILFYAYKNSICAHAICLIIPPLMLRLLTVRPFLQARQTCVFHRCTATGAWKSSLRFAGPMRPIAITTAAIGTSLVMKKPVFCEPVYSTTPSVPNFGNTFANGQSDDDDLIVSKSFFHKGELSFGILLGFCTGYLIKKIGKLFALAIGAGFIFLQYLSYQGFVTVHWDRLEGGYKKHLDIDKDGRVTRRDVRTRWNSIVNFLTHDIQFKSTFMIGLYTGIRYG